VILLLPPSETKRDGGETGTPLDLAALSYPALTAHRERALEALGLLSRDDAQARIALRLGSTQDAELSRNRRVRDAAVLPALELYTGVLYDSLEPTTLSAVGREFANRRLLIHSALFGLVRGGDQLPAYRLSHDSRLPGLSLRGHWRPVITAQLERETGLVVDARSDSYAALGPVPRTAWLLRVVSEQPGGRRVALSHFNKTAKGAFARAVAEAGIVHGSAESLVAWAGAQGIRLEAPRPGVLELVV
jgi:cytoplasmic iron level regulating protein YaaA (DUF328/UPF0246 family)